MNFQKLKFRIFDIPPEKDVLEEFSELRRYKVFVNSKAPHKNLLLRYMIFMYDPGSDLLKEVSELGRRKIRAAELAGFQHESDYLKEIFDLRDKTALDFLQCFLTEVYHNRKYTEWQVLHQELEENNRLRLEPITTKSSKKKDEEIEEVDIFEAAKKKGALRDQATSIHELIDAIEKEIFGDNEDVKEIAIKSRYLSPENFAGVKLAS
jgi:hypothetical protein